MGVSVKVCGISDTLSLNAAIEGGARWVGFVFYPQSPRFLALGEAAHLAKQVPEGILRVGLFVDPNDDVIDAAMREVSLDAFQLAGSEPYARCTGLSRRLPVYKSVAIRNRDDLATANEYGRVVSALLLDAPPPPGGLPGGNATSFDWTLLRGAKFPCPWFLAGGLTCENLGEATATSGARSVDVSSGVEAERGVKSPAKIRAFLAEAAALP